MAEKPYWEQRQVPMLTRRRLLRSTALDGAGLATAALIGCGRTERPAERPTTSEPKRGGILTRPAGSGLAYDTQGVGFDPHTYLAAAASGYRLFYQGLLGYDLRTYEVEPELAQRWEQPSSTEYLFTLQPGVKWQNKPPVNGRALTIEDVVFSLERARTPEPRFFSRSILATVDKIEAVDTDRLRITTKQPDAATLSKLSADLLMVLAPEVVERAGRFLTADTVVGTGAFIMKSAEQNVAAEYVRNPDYWKPGLPYLDGYRSQHFNDEQAAWAAFLGGQVDIARVPGVEVKKYIAQQGPNYSPDWYFDNTIRQLQPNVRVKPLDDARVTRALRLLVDHDEMRAHWTDVLYGRGRHGSIFPSALHTWDLPEEEYTKYIFWKQPKDEAAREAAALLNAAGFNRDNPLKFEVIFPGAGVFSGISQLLQAQWKRWGQGVVDIQLKSLDTAVANQLRAQRQFQYLVHGNVAGTTEPDAWLTELYRSGASANFVGFSDPKVDEMIDRQRTLFDLQQRKAAVREIIIYMIEHSPTVVAANQFMLNALQPRVRNFIPEYFPNGRQYEQIWLDT